MADIADQVAAARWAKRNARAFGGDAARIRGKQVPSPVEIEGELVERFLRDDVTHGINIANTGLVFETFIKE